MKKINKNTELDNIDKKLHISDVSESKTYTEDEVKEISWKAFMCRTDEREFELIHKKSAKDEFEKWWMSKFSE